ncbi:class 1 fructose-bisphosphatase [Campylobacter pinnipediorum]|uniref:class 1 fructose-bisphosphatase n=1 Tax=Campylobacter pinnipediorum TaxID=1965231 RepID=UPI0009956F23|nr:class 1 fructose-bisphosphatase [Campylobacter pinnipediorum]AQW81644.1 fructose-1,6-bisphosphatase I [Campylobacter pinnipediorum subsp. pinnipediorum]AQW83273.1 fructose-1,6-bisphosphatase I [Campylobacter pinnipediorum subsp. pinnipediorum]AQW84841.1 fructose-1,6-bisphosphatase I [Campylobacter pinnipediorum subsp. pinnipediorum]OPA79700.1 fructose-bisphosphatase [Campylobacter pinnipediorum subsp. pinnipediorum]
MEEIIKNIEKSVKQISEEIKYADLGYTQHANATGDTQLKLDVLSDNIITQNLSNISSVKAIVSEEKDEILWVNKDAKYIIAYDPLDGSSLVDVNFAIGSIFAIYEDELKPENLIAAIYSLYGPRVELVKNTQKNELPKLYRLDKENNFKFIKDLKLENKGKLNATGATQKGWSDEHCKFVRELFLQGYRLRYSGAMVSDLHQILLKGGGIFSYPATTDAPNGKLRALFEVLPFAFIYENAGGATSNGYSKTLFETKIEKIHQTTPCFFGSKDEIKLLYKFYGDKK